MEVVRLFLSIGMLTAAGYSVLQAVTGKDNIMYPFAEKIALSYVLGLGCVAFEMLIFAIAGLPFNLWMLILPWVPVFLFALYRGKEQWKFQQRGISWGFFARKTIFFKVLLLIIILQIASVFLRGLSKPLESYDAIINFGIKSKIFFMNNGIPMTFSTFEGIGKGHLDYPEIDNRIVRLQGF